MYVSLFELKKFFSYQHFLSLENIWELHDGYTFVPTLFITKSRLINSHILVKQEILE